MKYFIVGPHASGKQEVVDGLRELGVNCGRLFSNIDKPNNEVYGSNEFILYNDQIIHEIFENKAYIFMHELPTSNKINTYNVYEGLSYDEFDNNDVFIISPDQFMSIVSSSINEPVCFVWLDNKKVNRVARYHMEKREYNFKDRDDVEKEDMASFVKNLYSFNNSHVIYFTDEVPQRITVLLYSLIKHPELFDLVIKNFN